MLRLRSRGEVYCIWPSIILLQGKPSWFSWLHCIISFIRLDPLTSLKPAQKCSSSTDLFNVEESSRRQRLGPELCIKQRHQSWMYQHRKKHLKIQYGASGERERSSENSRRFSFRSFLQHSLLPGISKQLIFKAGLNFADHV